MSPADREQLEQQLNLIKQMVSASRRVRAESGDIYLVVGMLLFAGGIYDWGIASDTSWIAWPVAGALGWIYAVASGIRRARRETRVTYGPRIEGMAWTATCVAIAAMSGIYVPTGSLPIDMMFPLVGMMLAIPLAVSGSIYRYWPLTAGAGVFLLTGAFGVFVPADQRQLLFLLSMALGYIAPGIGMLRVARRHGPA